jgi:glycyl-tRNA synthetase
LATALSFQEVILRLQQFWAERGCTLWQPYSEKVGAGTMNPATVLRVLGPEPWNVAYVEPSYRPDDGRYGDNPNRMQMHTQFQVVLKPDPGNPQEQYLESLYALGIRREEHDIRFVEDNWESPALGAWGLGWEVWLDGLEITQFTYFQQAGGFTLDPVSVEITYGLERITMFLQKTQSVWEIDWDGSLTYGDVLLQPEIEHCTYGFELADVDRLSQLYNMFEAEAQACLEAGLVIPAHDYVLRCSHTFNILDARGAIGVTERATYFRRMRDLSRRVAVAYVDQRERLGYPMLKRKETASSSTSDAEARMRDSRGQETSSAPLLLEIGTEELPATDLHNALEQLRRQASDAFDEARIAHTGLRVLGTPRRLAILAEDLPSRQQPAASLVKGPPERAAFDGEGNPTQAAVGFARKQGVPVGELRVQDIDGGRYVVAASAQEGRDTPSVLSEILPDLVASLRFQKSMRWNQTNVSFSRPVRWLVALYGSQVVPFEYAGLASGPVSRASRPDGSIEFKVNSPLDYVPLLEDLGIIPDPAVRRQRIAQGAAELAASVGGRIPDDPALLEEVTNLVETPTPLLGRYDEAYLHLPPEVLIAVMKKHQRYFPIEDDAGRLLPHFVAVRNGGSENLDTVRQGNEEVIRARFADAEFFYREDTKKPLEEFLPRLATLTFQEQLGSMLDKTHRIEALVPTIAGLAGASESDTDVAVKAAHVCRADLATQMVVEMTSLQGIMGREYALKSGMQSDVAQAVFEQYLPRFSGDALPETVPGLLLGIASRLDSLAGLFSVGLVPTGSSDPYQLRRAALGLVQSLISRQMSFNITEGLSAGAALLPVKATDEALDAAQAFIVERLRGYLREQGFRYDIVEAVVAARGDDPYGAAQGVSELSSWVDRDDWPRILANYARCVRITRDLEEQLPLEPESFVESAETALHRAYLAARAQTASDASIDEFLSAFVSLVDPIDYFFAKESGVMVMADDPKLRRNRLALLQHIGALADGIVDLSRLEGF